MRARREREPKMSFGHLIENIGGIWALIIVGYGISAVFYFASLFSERETPELAASWIARVAWIFHTGVLASHWAQSGASHPPFVSLGESLVFTMWAMVSAYLWIEFYYGAKRLGLLPVGSAAVVLLALSSSLRAAPVGVLAELRSPWIYFHVTSGLFAYAFLSLSAVFALFYLVKERVSSAAFMRAGSFAFLLAIYILFQKTNPGHVSEAGVRVVLLVFTLSFLLTAFSKVSARKSKSMTLDSPKKRKGKNGEVAGTGESGALGKVTQIIFSSGVAGLIILTAASFVGMQAEHLFRNYINVVKFAALGLTCLAGITLVSLVFFRAQFDRHLPKANRMDRFSYQSLVFGFCLLTLNIIAGAFWSSLLRGQFWTGDPKEVWTVATWLIYGAYLSLRIWEGIPARRAALISLLGLAAVSLNLFIGLILPTLHSFNPG